MSVAETFMLRDRNERIETRAVVSDLDPKGLVGALHGKSKFVLGRQTGVPDGVRDEFADKKPCRKT
jgi:hypothetical protein